MRRPAADLTAGTALLTNPAYSGGERRRRHSSYHRLAGARLRTQLVQLVNVVIFVLRLVHDESWRVDKMRRPAADLTAGTALLTNPAYSGGERRRRHSSYHRLAGARLRTQLVQLVNLARQLNIARLSTQRSASKCVCNEHIHFVRGER